MSDNPMNYLASALKQLHAMQIELEPTFSRSFAALRGDPLVGFGVVDGVPQFTFFGKNLSEKFSLCYQPADSRSAWGYVARVPQFIDVYSPTLLRSEYIQDVQSFVGSNATSAEHGVAAV